MTKQLRTFVDDKTFWSSLSKTDILEEEVWVLWALVFKLPDVQGESPNQMKVMNLLARKNTPLDKIDLIVMAGTAPVKPVDAKSFTVASFTIGEKGNDFLPFKDFNTTDEEKLGNNARICLQEWWMMKFIELFQKELKEVSSTRLMRMQDN